jgi:hypothetical protein
MSDPTWQIMIPTIPHRHEKLLELLGVLDMQMQSGVQVLVYRDNLQASLPAKFQALMDAATAEYVSFIADDDSVCSYFIPVVLAAMQSGSDQIGFRVRYTESGVPQAPVIHSMRCGGWYSTPSGHYRDFMFFNPHRRKLVQPVKFRGLVCDEEWAEDLRALGVVKTETFIDNEIFYYRRTSSDNFHTVVQRQPLLAGAIPPLPSYPWLKILEADGHV